MTIDAADKPAAASSPVTNVNYVLGMLFVFYLLNFLDRQIINIVAEPIKQELGILDWQLGLLTGLAFAVFYTILGIPLARHVDKPHTDRPRVMALALAVWSGMTALCGAATSFLQLLVFRIGVGVGEAGCSPPAHSLISDIVPKERRASAMAIYSMGIPLGKLLGMVIGGVVAHIWGWRVAFFAVGLPGILIALIAWFTMPEPRRHAVRKITAPTESVWTALGRVAPIKTFWWISIAGAFMSFISYGQTAFLGSFYIRAHGMNVAEAGVTIGLALGISGALGTWLGGRVTDFAARKDQRNYVLVPLVSSLIGASAFAAAIIAPTVPISLVLLTIAGAFNSLWYGPVFAVVQSIVAPNLRATAAAGHLFLLAFIGLGLGPLTFGLLSDGFNHGFAPLGIPALGTAEGLRWALVAASVPAAVIALASFWAASRTITKELHQDA